MNIRRKSTRVAVPLQREHMPSDYGISLDRYVGRSGEGSGYTDGERRIPEDFGPSQAMHGFESTYQNIIDYIVRITYKIWEDRDVEYIADTYSNQSRVYDDYGLQRGNKKIIADTHHTTAAFSNIRLIADEVIWAGNDEVGYHTSHRTIIRGRNDGDSRYGPATGKDVDILVIANCVALDNEIFLEHVLYNNSCMLQQLGHDLNDMAMQMVRAKPAGWPRDEATWQGLKHAGRPTQPLSVSTPVNGFDIDLFARKTMNQIWNERDYSHLHVAYVPGFSFQGPTQRQSKGRATYKTFLETVFVTFPDLELQMDEVYWMGNDEQGYLSSERWSATATHLGSALYGQPTGIQVQIWGIAQHHVLDGKIVSEWMLFNELDVMMQIAKSRL
jgi:predicted ester cyclase